jgi:hypothetical protein
MDGKMKNKKKSSPRTPQKKKISCEMDLIFMAFAAGVAFENIRRIKNSWLK